MVAHRRAALHAAQVVGAGVVVVAHRQVRLANAIDARVGGALVVVVALGFIHAPALRNDALLVRARILVVAVPRLLDAVPVIAPALRACVRRLRARLSL